MLKTTQWVESMSLPLLFHLLTRCYACHLLWIPPLSIQGGVTGSVTRTQSLTGFPLHPRPCQLECMTKAALPGTEATSPSVRVWPMCHKFTKLRVLHIRQDGATCTAFLSLYRHNKQAIYDLRLWLLYYAEDKCASYLHHVPCAFQLLGKINTCFIGSKSSADMWLQVPTELEKKLPAYQHARMTKKTKATRWSQGGQLPHNSKRIYLACKLVFVTTGCQCWRSWVSVCQIWHSSPSVAVGCS